jgi:hypothetical protein
MSKKNNVSYLQFVAFWNRVQNQNTPHIHLRMAKWLQAAWYSGDQHLLLMAFRGCGKSTLVGLFCAWVLTQNSGARILVVSADDHLAIRMVRNVRRILERHPLCAHLIPKSPDQWAADRFTVERTAEWRDPSMMAAGITGNITGMRADLIICDDVEVPNTSDTTEKRDDLRARLRELSFIRTPDARMIYVGTPHAFDTIYATQVRVDIPGHAPFLPGYKELKIAAQDKDGTSIWPERFSDEYLRDVEHATGHAHFQSQMMLTPTNITLSHLDPALVHPYDDALIRSPFDGQLYVGDVKIVSSSAWWDPAMAQGRGDHSVLAVVLTGENGHIYVHNVTYLSIDGTEQEDNATAQCHAVIADLTRHYQTKVGLETNGIGNMLPGILRREIALSGADIAVVPMNTRDAKDIRILRAFETRLAARMVHVHRTVFNTPFFDEMRDFKVGRKNRRDDGLDAVASAIALEPMRMPHVLGRGRRKQFNVKTT